VESVQAIDTASSTSINTSIGAAIGTAGGTSGEPPDDCEAVGVNHLTYQLAKAEHLLEQRLDHALGEVGLTLRQFTVLAHVGRAPGMSRADVARLLLTTPQAVGGWSSGWSPPA